MGVSEFRKIFPDQLQLQPPKLIIILKVILKNVTQMQRPRKFITTQSQIILKNSPEFILEKYGVRWSLPPPKYQELVFYLKRHPKPSK